MGDDTPVCVECGTPLTRAEGQLRRPAKRCSAECRAIAARRRAAAWYIDHKDDPAWTGQVLTRKRAADKRWREANPEYVRERMAKYRAASPEAIAEQYRRWRIANADRVIEKNQRRRARLLAAFVEQVDPEKLWKRDGGICQLCKEPVDLDLKWPNPFSRTFDHIVPLSKGGTHEFANVQLAHAVCNSIKGDRT